MDIEALAKKAGMVTELQSGAASCVWTAGLTAVSAEQLNEFARLVAAEERAANDATKGRLAGAIHALNELRERVPPKDWKRYADDVLALDKHVRSNV